MVQCSTCHRNFISDAALDAHRRDKADHPYCTTCERAFVDKQALNAHCRDSGNYHTYCGRCERLFGNAQSLHAHCRDKADHPYCVQCEQLFVDKKALKNHLMSASAHRDGSEGNEDDAYCADCKKYFVNENALRQHLATSSAHQEDSESESESESEASDNEYEYEYEEDSDDEESFCKLCNQSFLDNAGLYKHLARSPRHNWCFICSRDFISRDALNKHTASPVHHARTMKCPLCSEMFKASSSIALHIESGTCHPKVTRHHVTAAVHSLNIIPTISVDHRISAGNTTFTPPVLTRVSATENAFNGTSYECYLCSKRFRTIASLNSHLNSPAHDENEFKCPKCKKEFTLISGLTQHIESEACGVAKFAAVREQLDGLTDSFKKMLAF